MTTLTFFDAHPRINRQVTIRASDRIRYLAMSGEERFAHLNEPDIKAITTQAIGHRPISAPTGDIAVPHAGSDEAAIENMPHTISETLRHALAYLAMGFHIIPAKRIIGNVEASKEPVGGWPWKTRKLTSDDVANYLGRELCNVAVVLGKPSGGITDVDLDWHEAPQIADIVFADCPSFGRTGKLRSHRIATCEGIKSKKIALPLSLSGHPKVGGEHAMCIGEIRSDGAYTIWPASIHGSGEKIDWDGPTPDKFPKLTPEDMQSRIGLVAFAAFCARFFPALGLRCDYMMAVAGALAHAGVDSSIIQRLVQKIGEINHDAGTNGQWRVANERAVERVEQSEEVTGIPTIITILGMNDDVANFLRECLGTTDSRPHVVLDPFDLNGTLDETEAALIGGGAPIYQRGGLLVHAHRLDDDKIEYGISRKKGSLGIHPVNSMRLTQYIDKCVAVFRKTKNSPKRVASSSFSYLAAQIAARVDQWHFKVLDGIIECPTLRADGTVLSAPGYDSASRLFLDAGDLQVPTIPEELTHDDAKSAVTVLTGILNEFPFVPDDENTQLGALAISSSSQSVAISAILTGLVRRSMTTAPIYGVDANSVATGKSTLCDLVSVIVTGRECAVMTLPSDEIELQKAWLSTLINGDPVICIDNVPAGQRVGGGVLAKIITQSRFKGRLLGSNTEAEVPTNVLILVNGNNLCFADDLASRAVNARMNCGQEYAYKRTFRRDIIAYAKERRGEIVAAALTILRAYILAGRPGATELEPSRFHEWDRLIRGAIIWCGEPDPWQTARLIDAADPAKADLAVLIDAFEKCFKNCAVTSKEIAMRIGGQPDDDGIALRDALSTVTDGRLGQRSITAAIRARADQIVSGRRFRCRTDSSQVVHFKVEVTSVQQQGALL